MTLLNPGCAMCMPFAFKPFDQGQKLQGKSNPYSTEFLIFKTIDE